MDESGRARGTVKDETTSLPGLGTNSRHGTPAVGMFGLPVTLNDPTSTRRRIYLSNFLPLYLRTVPGLEIARAPVQRSLHDTDGFFPFNHSLSSNNRYSIKLYDNSKGIRCNEYKKKQWLENVQIAESIIATPSQLTKHFSRH